MHRIDGAGATVDNKFTDGNPAIGVPATTVTADILNALQEENCTVIEQAGLALNKADNTQLRQAMLKMISDAAKTVRIDNAAFGAGVADGDAVRWDAGTSTFVEAIADGTSNNRAAGIADVTNARVYAYGETSALLSGLTPGGRYYLSAASAGGITDVAPADKVAIGIAKSATTLFVDIDVVQTDYKTGTMLMWPSRTCPGWALVRDGAAVSRATYSALFVILCPTRSGTLTSGSNIVTGLSSTTDLHVGMPIEGNGVPAVTTISSIDGPTQIKLSANATASGAQTLRVFPYGAGDGSTTYNVMDDREVFERGWAATARGYDKSDITGTTTNGSAVVTGLASTVGLFVGQAISAASGVPGGTTILSIDSATQITLSANATATGARTLTVTGRTFGSEQADELKSHTHDENESWHGGIDGGGPGVNFVLRTAANNTFTLATGGQETRPRNRAYLPIIVY